MRVLVMQLSAVVERRCQSKGHHHVRIPVDTFEFSQLRDYSESLFGLTLDQLVECLPESLFATTSILRVRLMI